MLLEKLMRNGMQLIQLKITLIISRSIKRIERSTLKLLVKYIF